MKVSSLVVCGSLLAVGACSSSPTAPSTPPALRVTRFTAFGNSITAGMLSDGSRTISYGERVEAALRAQYPAQAPIVEVSALPGEAASEALGRLEAVLAGGPEAILLLEGANDLSWGEVGLEYAVGGLASMVVAARARGVMVFLGTLPPQRDGYRGGQEHLVWATNARIRALSAGRAELVDVHAALSSDPHRYIGDDGLHPTEEGYSRIAEAFVAAITAHCAK